MLLNIECDNDN